MWNKFSGKEDMLMSPSLNIQEKACINTCLEKSCSMFKIDKKKNKCMGLRINKIKCINLCSIDNQNSTNLTNSTNSTNFNNTISGNGTIGNFTNNQTSNNSFMNNTNSSFGNYSQNYGVGNNTNFTVGNQTTGNWSLNQSLNETFYNNSINQTQNKSSSEYKQTEEKGFFSWLRKVFRKK